MEIKMRNLIFLFVLILAIPTYATVVHNGTTSLTAYDSLPMPFTLIDANGNAGLVALASPDVIYLRVSDVNGLCYEETMNYNDAKIVATTTSSVYSYLVKTQVSNIDGVTPRPGPHTWELIVSDISLGYTSRATGVFELYTTATYATVLDSLLSAAANIPTRIWADTSNTGSQGEREALLIAGGNVANWATPQDFWDVDWATASATAGSMGDSLGTQAYVQGVAGSLDYTDVLTAAEAAIDNKSVATIGTGVTWLLRGLHIAAANDSSAMSLTGNGTGHSLSLYANTGNAIYAASTGNSAIELVNNNAQPTVWLQNSVGQSIRFTGDISLLNNLSIAGDILADFDSLKTKIETPGGTLWSIAAYWSTKNGWYSINYPNDGTTPKDSVVVFDNTSARKYKIEFRHSNVNSVVDTIITTIP